MEAIDSEKLLLLCPQMQSEHVQPWLSILNTIECPEDFQGLEYVLQVLYSAYLSFPALFSQTFDLKQVQSSHFFDGFMKADTDTYPKYSLKKLPLGSKSERPIFALLFTFCDRLTSNGMHSYLLFLDHYCKNEASISARGKEEDVFRAYRLLYTDQLFEHQRLIGQDANVVAGQLDDFKRQLSLLDNNDEAKRMIGYVRELIHFYRLDWSARTRRRRKSKVNMRASFQRSGYERVVGTDDLYTFKIKTVSLSDVEKLSGIAAEEDLPPLSFIKTEASETAKPEHEMPSTAIIRDQKKEQIQQRIIQQNTKKSHNLTLLSRNVLQQYELHYLLDELLSQRKGKLHGIDKRQIRVLTLLCLALGRSVEDVHNLRILSSELTDGEGLYKKQHVWNLKAHHLLTAKLGAQHENNHLLNVGNEIHIQLPSWLSDAIDKSGIPIKPEFIRSYSKGKIIQAVDQLLRNINKKHHCQISIKRITYHLTNYVVAREKIDPVVLECLTGKPSYYTRAPRHYAWYSPKSINKIINSLYKDMFPSLHDCKTQSGLVTAGDVVDKSKGVGSQFTPKRSSLQKLVESLMIPLQNTSAFDATSDLASVISYHNTYTLYTLYLLFSATGYRAVGNPLPAFSLHLIRYGALCISDKDSVSTFAHMRVIACSKTLEHQLVHYLSHIQALARILNVTSPHHSSQYKWQSSSSQFIDLKSKNDKLDWFIGVKNSKGNDGLFLFFELSETGIINATNAFPKNIKERSDQLPDLPMNFGRHYLRYYLQQMGTHQELVKFQLGHWVAGENPLELFSSLPMADTIQTLQPILDNMINELGWVAIPSLLTRKRQ